MEIFAFWSELLDPRVATVGDPYVSLMVDSEAARGKQVSSANTRRTEFPHESAFTVELLDSIRFLVGNP